MINGLGDSGTTNGAGNLIIGYDSFRAGTDDLRSGSRNLVLGDQIDYRSFGGIVIGAANSISSGYACVLSGRYNVADSDYSTVLGCESNTTRGFGSSVTGGTNNFA